MTDSTIILRGGVEVENPLEVALEFLGAFSSYDAYESSAHVVRRE